jgi:hypothetical protein
MSSIYYFKKCLNIWYKTLYKKECLICHKDDILLNKHVKRFPPTWNTETFIRRAKETAGILLGRTTIESWMCGKKSWIYNVDKSGGILNKELVSPPQDINKFYGSTVCEKLVDSYLNIINETSN